MFLQVFDAVVVCNGHYSEPNLPDVPGADTWPGLQMHSHNYRVPEQFAGQVVVIVGASNSGKVAGHHNSCFTVVLEGMSFA